MSLRMESLKEKTLNGVIWSFVDNLANNGIVFLTGIVLARILSPSEFGIIGMITVFIAISNSIVDSGFSNALIRKNNADDIDFNTVFYFNILLGVILYVCLFLASRTISNFFNQPILIPVTRVMGLILIINAFSLIHRTKLVKKVDFKTQAGVSLISSVASGSGGIVMALHGYGVWSLVGQQVTRYLLNSVLLWFCSDWRPAPRFSKKSFSELFGFGSKLLLSGLFNTIFKNIYYLVIGKFYSPALLGQYTRAESFNSIFSTNLTSVVQRVSYPVLSSIREDEEKLKQAYRRVIKTTMVVTFSCMLGLAAVAKPLILVLIGEKWMPGVYYMQIICFSAMLYPLHALNLNILQVKGRSDLFLNLEIVKKIIAVIPIIAGIFFGIEFMLWGNVLASFIAFFLNSYYSADLINYSAWLQIRDLLPAFVISCFVSAVTWSITFLGFSAFISLQMQIICGLSMTVLIYEIVKLPEYRELKEIFFSGIKTLTIHA